MLGITSAGKYTIRALGAPSDGADTGGTAVKRAAFVRTPGGSGEADGVWVEFVGGGSQWGLSEDGVTDVKALNSAGLFLRKEGTLIDAKRQLCGDAVYADAWEWQEAELNEVTLTAGRAFLDQSTGIELSGVSVAADGGSVSFDVAYLPVDSACRRDYPRIGEGLFGEYMLLINGSCSNCDVQSQIDDLRPSVAAAPRVGFFRASQVEDTDSGSCAAATFALDVAELPAGWGKVSRWGDVDGDGIEMWAGSTPYHDFPFALTIPADAADGDYDMCVLAYNTISGLQTAKPFRVTLPEADWQYWCAHLRLHHHRRHLQLTSSASPPPSGRTTARSITILRPPTTAARTSAAVPASTVAPRPSRSKASALGRRVHP